MYLKLVYFHHLLKSMFSLLLTALQRNYIMLTADPVFSLEFDMQNFSGDSQKKGVMSCNFQISN